MKKSLLVLLGTLLSFNIAAQTDFREGYVINQKNDTIKGLVYYGGSKRNAKICEFKRSSTAQVETFGPSEIRGYGFVNDKYYQSIDAKALDKQEPIFVEELVRGLVSLHKEDASVFYITKGDTTLHRLVLTRKVQTINGKTVRLKSAKHIGILTYMMQDCDLVQEKIRKASVSEKFLTELVEEYNRCVSSSYVSYKSSKAWLTTKFGANVGYRMSKPVFFKDGSGFDYWANADFTDQQLIAGALIDFHSPRINERLAVQIGFLYCDARYEGHSEKNFSFSSYKYNINFSLKELYIPLGIQYKFFEGVYAPYINFGISSTLHLKSDYLQVVEYMAEGNVSTTKSTDFLFTKHQLGLWGGLGAERTISGKLKGFIELRYEKTKGFAHPLDWYRGMRMAIDNYYFNVGVKFPSYKFKHQ